MQPLDFGVITAGSIDIGLKFYSSILCRLHYNKLQIASNLMASAELKELTQILLDYPFTELDNNEYAVIQQIF